MYICLYIFSERQSLIARRMYDRWTVSGWEVRGGLPFKEHFSWVSISMWKTKEEPYKKRQQLVEKSLECSGNKMYAPRMKKKALDFVTEERSRVWQRDYCRGGEAAVGRRAWEWCCGAGSFREVQGDEDSSVPWGRGQVTSANAGSL